MLQLLRSVTITLALVGCAKSVAPAADPADQTTTYPEGFTLLEAVERQGDEVVIPFKKFRMDNGLTVILHEDNSDPLVHVDVTYHVGSAREDIGKSGFAHFFEHMMFQGSENVADEEHFKTITAAGGTLNGTTNRDRTNYFETVPSNQLEKMLWLEADRMGFLLDAVTQEKFEVQRETVKNERGQRVDNAPYGLLRERVGEALYPEGHPYSWSVIGYIEDLNRADVNDLKRFFLRWYGPNNAVLTVGGRFDEQQTLEWVGKYFGSIPEGPAVEPAEFVPVTLDQTRYISLEDNVALPLIHMSWPTVYARHADEAPLDVLMNILGTGKTSLLYKNLVKEGLAVQAQAGHGCSELHCTFTLLALPSPTSGKNLADIEGVLRGSLEEFETRGVLDDDLQRVKAGIVSGMIFGLESVSGKVSTLAYNETFTGDANYIHKDIARYEGVTKEDVVRVYEQYIKDQPSVVMSIVPKGQLDLIAHEDTWSRYERAIPESVDEGELEMRRAEDDFDRSVRPDASGENPKITLPAMWRSELDNGVQVLGAVNDETPTTAIRVRVEAGQRLESLEQLGLASLTAKMLNEATDNATNEEISNALDKLGSSISVSAGDDYVTMTIRSLTEHLDDTLQIAVDKLLSPKLDEADFARVKDQTLQGLEVAKTRPSTTASDVFRRLVYGSDNTASFPDDGITKTVEALTLDDVRGFYEANYASSRGSILAVSDLSEEVLLEKLAVFSDWEDREVEVTEAAPLPELEPGTLYLVDKPGAAQSELRIGKQGPVWDATGEFYRADLMNYALGGAFNGRINLNLREDKGYTYGARSYFVGNRWVGRFTVGSGVRTDVTGASISEIIKELEAYHAEGITAEELEFTKSSIGQRDARAYETPRQKLNFLADILTYDLPDGFVDEQAAILQALAKEEVDGLAAKHVDPATMILLVVGDKAKILPELEELGYPIVELDADGEPIE